MKTPFLKMHGTGNDFVVLDARAQSVSMTGEVAKRLSDRHFGIGCDQLVVLERSSVAEAAMAIYNADGSQISTCGNATRCVADMLMRESGKNEAVIETKSGIRKGWRAENGDVTVNMGAPHWDWRDVPLAESRNTLHLGIAEGLLTDPVALSMGNPHVVFFVRDLSLIQMEKWGAKLEVNPLFPQRANISAVQVISPTQLKMIVWERGAGITLACGSGACAAAVAAVRRELCERRVTVALPGGTLAVEWQKTDDGSTGDVLMSGSVAYVFEGTVAL